MRVLSFFLRVGPMQFFLVLRLYDADDEDVDDRGAGDNDSYYAQAAQFLLEGPGSVAKGRGEVGEERKIEEPPLEKCKSQPWDLKTSSCPNAIGLPYS